jgi:hypothetical protein
MPAAERCQGLQNLGRGSVWRERCTVYCGNARTRENLIPVYYGRWLSLFSYLLGIAG